jgi:flagellar basal-body rod modification protein FlgD
METLPVSSRTAALQATSNSSTPTASLVGKTGAISAAEGRDTFLRLLVAQLEHQDPLKPMENADFTAQLAQFSMLEQIETMNTNLRAVVEAQQALTDLQAKMQASDLIGKEVKIRNNTMQVQNGQPNPMSYKLAAPSAQVTIQVVDRSGQTLQTFALTNQAAGDYVVPQTGATGGVDKLPDGEYSIKVTATDNAGEPVAVETFVQGRVNGIEYSTDQPYFVIGTRRVAFSEILSILE